MCFLRSIKNTRRRSHKRHFPENILFCCVYVLCACELLTHEQVLFPRQPGSGRKDSLPRSNLFRFRHTYKDPWSEHYEGEILKPKEKIILIFLKWPLRGPTIIPASLSLSHMLDLSSSPSVNLGCISKHMALLFPQIQPSSHLSQWFHLLNP